MLKNDDQKTPIEAIKELIKEKKWAEAHRACLEILRYDPENIKTISLKKLIEKKVKKINQKAIKDDLEKLKPLWKEEKYEELIIHLNKLIAYIPDYPKLQSIIIKAQNLYQNQNKFRNAENQQGQLELIERNIAAKQFSEALMRTGKLQSNKKNNVITEKVVNRIKNLWIDEEINDNKQLLESNKFNEIVSFYEKLLNMDSSSTKLKERLLEAKKNLRKQTVENQQEFINKGLEQIGSLYQLEKFDRARDAAEDILRIDPGNKTARKMLKESVDQLKKGLNDEVITQMLESQQHLKEEMKKNPEEYIKI